MRRRSAITSSRRTTPVGHAKARFFTSLGFTQENWPELRDALLRLAHEAQAEPEPESPFGQKYVLRGMIEGPGTNTNSHMITLDDKRHFAVLAFPLVLIVVPLLLDAASSERLFLRSIVPGGKFTVYEQRRADYAFVLYMTFVIPALLGHALAHLLHYLIRWRGLRYRSTLLTPRRLLTLHALAGLAAWGSVALMFGVHALVWRQAPNFADRYLLFLPFFAPFIASLLVVALVGRRHIPAPVAAQ